MNTSQARKAVCDNPALIILMEQNIEEGYMGKDSQDCKDALHGQYKEAKKVLENVGVFAI